MSIVATFGGGGITATFSGGVSSSVPASTASNDFLVGNGTTFVKKTFAETQTVLGVSGTNTGDQDLSGYALKDYDPTIADGATPAIDLLSSKSGVSDWDSAQTASTLTISNAPAKGVRYLAINKQSTSDLAIQLVGTDVDANNLVFEFFDKTNECYTVGDTVTLVNAIGDTSFSLSLVFTGLYDGSGNLRVQVSGTYDSFSTA